jgi:hypothetical protein
MSIRGRRSVNIFTKSNGSINRSIFNPVALFPLSSLISLVPLSDTKILTPLQYNQFVQIEKNYTSHLSTRDYINISSNSQEYLALLKSVQSINYTNKIYQLLIKIGIESFMSSLQIYSLYEVSTYDDLKLLQLNMSLDEILSKINETKVIDEFEGQFNMTKTFNLSPIYSDYITLYGLPAFGVGFDPIKLDLVSKFKNLPSV